MRIATWNVNSINVRLPQLIGWLREADVDVLCVQETKCTDDRFPEAILEEAGYKAVFHGEKSYNGVAILSRLPITDVRMGFDHDDTESQKRLIAATVNRVRIVNCYFPNGQSLDSDKFVFKLDWIQHLRNLFDSDYTTDEMVLLCGDFNVAPERIDVWNPAAFEGHTHFSLPERAAITYVKQWGFTDAFRKINPDVKQFSWWDYRAGAWQKNQGLRIDQIWVSTPLAATLKDSWIDTEPRKLEKPSDHTPVVAEFNV
jgi:exodeoxyribonuclease-3